MPLQSARPVLSFLPADNPATAGFWTLPGLHPVPTVSTADSKESFLEGALVSESVQNLQDQIHDPSPKTMPRSTSKVHQRWKANVRRQLSSQKLLLFRRSFTAQRLGPGLRVKQEIQIVRRTKPLKGFLPPRRRRQAPNNGATKRWQVTHLLINPALWGSPSKDQTRRASTSHLGAATGHFPPWLPGAQAWLEETSQKSYRAPTSLTLIKLGFHFWKPL